MSTSSERLARPFLSNDRQYVNSAAIAAPTMPPGWPSNSLRTTEFACQHSKTSRVELSSSTR